MSVKFVFFAALCHFLDAFRCSWTLFGRFLDTFRRFLDAFWTLFRRFLDMFFDVFWTLFDAFDVGEAEMGL